MSIMSLTIYNIFEFCTIPISQISRLCLILRNFEENERKRWKRKKKKGRRNEKVWKNIKNFKADKLFLDATSYSFHFILQRLNNLKMHNFLTNFSYILFPFAFSRLSLASESFLIVFASFPQYIPGKANIPLSVFQLSLGNAIIDE